MALVGDEGGETRTEIRQEEENGEREPLLQAEV